MYESLILEGYDQIQLVGIGKEAHINFLSNWTSESDVGVCTDSSPYLTWDNWGANQRDLFILNANGELVYHEIFVGHYIVLTSWRLV